MTPRVNTPIIQKCRASYQINFFSKAVVLQIEKERQEGGPLYVQGDTRRNSHVMHGPCLDPDSNNTNAKSCPRGHHSNLTYGLVTRLHQGVIINVVWTGNGIVTI